MLWMEKHVMVTLLRLMKPKVSSHSLSQENKMMKISLSTGYAMASVGYIAQHYKEGKISAIHISKEYDIPIEYLFKILQPLVKANVLQSKKGPKGGYALARPAKDITLLEIIESIEGPMLRHIQLIERSNNEPSIRKMEEVCQSASEKTRELYSKTTLAKMLK